MSFLYACALTVAIETPFLMLFGFRDRNAVTIIVCVNVITNLLLNLILALTGFLWPLALALECAVVAAEYAVYALAFGRGRRLFWLTLAANVLSFGIGLLVFSPF